MGPVCWPAAAPLSTGGVRRIGGCLSVIIRPGAGVAVGVMVHWITTGGLFGSGSWAAGTGTVCTGRADLGGVAGQGWEPPAVLRRLAGGVSEGSGAA
jgi:hypothetical protein